MVMSSLPAHGAVQSQVDCTFVYSILIYVLFFTNKSFNPVYKSIDGL